MTKQEEIKRLMQRKIELGVSFGFTPEQVADEVWSFLHSQGVVIQIELPRHPGDRDYSDCGFTYEPLIEE